MHWSCWYYRLLLVTFLLSVAAEAAARGTDPNGSGDASVEQARQLFNEGLAFVEQEDWEQAEDRFRRVLAFKSSHVASYNLASALVHLGRLVESSELLRVVLRDPAVDPHTRDASQQLLSEIEPRIGSLTIRISGDSSDASLSLDRKPLDLDAAVQAISVDPGLHHVAALRGATTLAEQDVSVGGEAPLRVEVTLELPRRIMPQAALVRAPEPAPFVAAPHHDAPVRDEESGSVLTKWWLWTGVGAAVAAGVIVALVAPSSEQAKPVAGDTDPRVVHGRVQMGGP